MVFFRGVGVVVLWCFLSKRFSRLLRVYVSVDIGAFVCGCNDCYSYY